MTHQGPHRRQKKLAAIKAAQEREARTKGELVDHTPDYELVGRSKEIQTLARAIGGWNIPQDAKQRIVNTLHKALNTELDTKTAINIAKIFVAIEKNELSKVAMMVGAEKSGLGPQVKETSVDSKESTEMSGVEFFDKLLAAATTKEQVMTLRELVARMDN